MIKRMTNNYMVMKKISFIVVFLFVAVYAGACNEKKAKNDVKHDFAIDFLKESMTMYGDENLLVSPLSAEVALSLTANGAKDETQKEMLEMIGMTDRDLAAVNRYYSDLMVGLPKRDKVSIVKIANAVWIDDEFKLSENFADSAKIYRSNVDAIDLQNPANAKVLNKWAADNTENLINNIVNERMFSPSLRMVIANALYFKGRWQTKFEESMTKQRPFYKENGEEVQVRMMRKTAHYRYIRPEKCNFQIACLDYKGGAYEMIVVLPDKGASPESVLNELTTEQLTEWSNNTMSKNLQLELPSFKVEWGKSLNDCFKKMGMERAFSGKADFSGMTDSERLCISDISQFTYMNVDEDGTEAAAVTVVALSLTSAGPQEVHPFVVDHPFLLFIRDKKSGAILFAGKIGNPAK